MQPVFMARLFYDGEIGRYGSPANKMSLPNSSAAKATDAHFRPDKPWGAIGKSLIVLNLWLTLNQRVPGSSPGAPTTQSPETRN